VVDSVINPMVKARPNPAHIKPVLEKRPAGSVMTSGNWMIGNDSFSFSVHAGARSR
jgi:hypothetical protein